MLSMLAHMPGGASLDVRCLRFWSAAVCTESRVLTRSIGYVASTDMKPATVPAKSRRGIDHEPSLSARADFKAWKTEYWTAEYGTTRTQLIPFPRYSPFPDQTLGNCQDTSPHTRLSAHNGSTVDLFAGLGDGLQHGVIVEVAGDVDGLFLERDVHVLDAGEFGQHSVDGIGAA
ncbi:hypothetical protein OGAPHI_000767 [Ogataea philodendri]|uniref:Uncharacterized protein n=1 Tax=Ogataea philodendri TaxID=1378263 RepID=A0A9P8T9N4_9ASCO|nr:uncharacterized protein OGAPHI_000767 [Ogataea philodendri]KAH3671056.1 hypothetical protein OGAPHI_000767 [Ogataea philodendri]